MFDYIKSKESYFVVKLVEKILAWEWEISFKSFVLLLTRRMISLGISFIICLREFHRIHGKFHSVPWQIIWVHIGLNLGFNIWFVFNCRASQNHYYHAYMHVNTQGKVIETFLNFPVPRAYFLKANLLTSPKI